MQEHTAFFRILRGMGLQKKDDINNLLECWKKATDNVLIQDEGRMAEFWNKRSVNYANNIEKDNRKKRTDEILEFLKESDAGQEHFLFLSQSLEQKLLHLTYLPECLTD